MLAGLITGCAVLLGASAARADPPVAPSYDIVIAGGTVVDPDSGVEAVLDVGITDGTIAALSKRSLAGARRLGARGKHVVPGFIDVTSYGPYRYSSKFKIADGVTTSLSLHGGTSDFASWERLQHKNRPMLNYGSAVSHHFLRKRIGPYNRYRGAKPSQIREFVRRVRRSIEAGALGVSFSLEYTPGSALPELRALVFLAGEYGVPAFFHLRYSDPEPPGTNVEAVDEVIALAKETGATIHIHHITSTGGTFTMPQTVAQIDAARAEGLDIHASLYPYHYWATYLNSARFDPGWRERFRIDYEDLQLAGTETRLNRRSFTRLRETKRVAVAYAIPPADVITGLRTPWIMIGSDSVIARSGRSHPRGAGSFARLIGKYVRDDGILTLAEAVTRASLLPAQTFAGIAPALANKGRIQVGMDADIVVFDLAQIADAATVAEPRAYSQGIDYVLVNGVLLREGDEVNYAPVGRLIRSRVRGAEGKRQESRELAAH